MSHQILKRFGYATVACAVLALPLTGCGNPDGVQENPYAAPGTEPAAEAGSDTATEETPAAAESESSNTTE